MSRGAGTSGGNGAVMSRGVAAQTSGSLEELTKDGRPVSSPISTAPVNASDRVVSGTRNVSTQPSTDSVSSL